MIRPRPAAPPNDEAVRWNRAMGEVWSQILRSLNLDIRGTVVEIGPGFSEKIAYGLAEIGFRGTIVLVDPTPSARRWARRRYRQLLPSARTFAEPFTLAEAMVPPGEACALVSNHVFDDMLLRLATPPSVSASLFKRMGPGRACATEFVKTWVDLQSNPSRLAALIDEAAVDFARCATRIAPRLVVANQYPSWTQQRQGLASIHECGLRVLHRLEGLLEAAGFVRTVEPVAAAPGGATWLAMSSTSHAPPAGQ